MRIEKYNFMLANLKILKESLFSKFKSPETYSIEIKSEETNEHGK